MPTRALALSETPIFVIYVNDGLIDLPVVGVFQSGAGRYLHGSVRLGGSRCIFHSTCYRLQGKFYFFGPPG